MEYKRVIREDLSDRLIHLTRSLTHKESGNVLSAILRERQLRGGTGNIKGGYTCVCFSEAPIGKLGQILAQPMAHKVRYKPYGVMVAKEWLFSQGGRPAIYQPDGEFTDLPESHRHRHVCYDPPGVDFSWEREWRIRTDALALDPEILFLDEPTSGLDPISAGDFDQLILTLQRTSAMAVFMVTHDLDSLHTICDRIAVLGEGKIIEAGNMDTMLASQHPWLRAYFHGVRARAGLQAAARN
jgi:hypothetical protein